MYSTDSAPLLLLNVSVDMMCVTPAKPCIASSLLASTRVPANEKIPKDFLLAVELNFWPYLIWFFKSFGGISQKL
jgi:hypothetical protein